MLKHSLKYSPFQTSKNPPDSNVVVEEENPDRETTDSDNNNNNNSNNDKNDKNDNNNENSNKNTTTTTTNDDPTETHRPKRLALAPLPSLVHSHAFSHREKVVGLKDAGTLGSSWRARRQEFLQTSREVNVSTDTIAVPTNNMTTIEGKEEIARMKEMKNPIALLLLGNLAALKVVVFYLISLETVITCSITAYLIVFWYNLAMEHDTSTTKWTGGSMDFIILAFAVISPVSMQKYYHATPVIMRLIVMTSLYFQCGCRSRLPLEWPLPDEKVP